MEQTRSRLHLHYLSCFKELSATLIEVANSKAREAEATRTADRLKNTIEDLYRFASLVQSIFLLCGFANPALASKA